MAKPLRKSENIIRDKIPKEGHYIAYNVFASDEFHGHDRRPIYRLLIKFRNPDNIVEKFQKQFIEHEFKTPIEVTKRLEGHIEGTVNNYLLVDFLVSRTPNKLDWNWTNMPVVKDPNLFESYRKNHNLNDYVEGLMNH